MHSPSLRYAMEPMFKREGLYTKSPFWTILYGLRLMSMVLALEGLNVPSLFTP